MLYSHFLTFPLPALENNGNRIAAIPNMTIMAVSAVRHGEIGDNEAISFSTALSERYYTGHKYASKEGIKVGRNKMISIARYSKKSQKVIVDLSSKEKIKGRLVGRP